MRIYTKQSKNIFHRKNVQHYMTVSIYRCHQNAGQKHTGDMQKLDHMRKAMSKSSTTQQKSLRIVIYSRALNKHFFFTFPSFCRALYHFSSLQYLMDNLNETKEYKSQQLAHNTHIITPVVTPFPAASEVRVRTISLATRHLPTYMRNVYSFIRLFVLLIMIFERFFLFLYYI